MVAPQLAHESLQWVRGLRLPRTGACNGCRPRGAPRAAAGASGAENGYDVAGRRGLGPTIQHTKLMDASCAMLKILARLPLLGLIFFAAQALPAAGEQNQAAVPNNPNCRNSGSFEAWLAQFRQEARGNGVSGATIAAALDGMTLDPGIIQRDRRQGFFAQTFTAFSGKLITSNRIQNGLGRLKQHRELLARIEAQWGVPGPVIVAFWGLESDFGSMMGNLPVLRSLATLAYDCRRPDLFRAELMEALRIIDRGDLRPEDMIGSWAGELGQTQFLPAHYMQHAVDYDG